MTGITPHTHTISRTRCVLHFPEKQTRMSTSCSAAPQWTFCSHIDRNRPRCPPPPSHHHTHTVFCSVFLMTQKTLFQFDVTDYMYSESRYCSWCYIYMYISYMHIYMRWTFTLIQPLIQTEAGFMSGWYRLTWVWIPAKIRACLKQTTSLVVVIIIVTVIVVWLVQIHPAAAQWVHTHVATISRDQKNQGSWSHRVLISASWTWSETLSRFSKMQEEVTWRQEPEGLWAGS